MTTTPTPVPARTIRARCQAGVVDTFAKNQTSTMNGAASSSAGRQWPDYSGQQASRAVNECGCSQQGVKWINALHVPFNRTLYLGSVSVCQGLPFCRKTCVAGISAHET